MIKYSINPGKKSVAAYFEDDDMRGLDILAVDLMCYAAIVALISLWVFLGIRCAKSMSKKIKEVFIKLLGGRPIG